MTNNLSKMIIELDEERMEKDGLDVELANNQIEKIRKNTCLYDDDDIKEIKKHFFVGNSGIMIMFQDALEKQQWIMKYVKKWHMDYGDGEDNDLIEAMRDLGKQVGYGK